jgi:hypothetical protein
MSAAPVHRPGVRRAALAMTLLLLCQFALGMVTNLYLTIPRHHPGFEPSSYLSGSARSVGWAIAHGSTGLAAHAALGLALVASALLTALYAIVLRQGRTAAIAGALLIVGAGFNGASFLDFNHDISSLIMALLFAAALLAYVSLIYLEPVERLTA